MSNASFNPSGNTVLCSLTTSTALGPTQWSTGNMAAAYVSNNSTNAVYLAFQSSGAPTASVPTTGGAVGVCLLAGQSRVFTLGPNIANKGWLSACTSAATASVYVTAGTGQ
jgi:hypothetical protein